MIITSEKKNSPALTRTSLLTTVPTSLVARQRRLTLECTASLYAASSNARNRSDPLPSGSTSPDTATTGRPVSAQIQATVGAGRPAAVHGSIAPTVLTKTTLSANALVKVGATVAPECVGRGGLAASSDAEHTTDDRCTIDDRC